MAPGALARWLKKEGDPVRRGDFLAQIETDKATMELEAEHDGVLTQIVVAEGSTEIAADTVLAILGS
jgi:pyruvate dehydrogenase E1 component beta subunit